MPDYVLGIFLGIGLAAACGFRVFVPLFVLSLGALSGHLPVALAPGFAWVGTPGAAVALGVATALEVGAYYIPLLDNLLDGIASPAAVVAGILVTAPFVADLGPMLQWTVAVIAGGAAAATTQALTVTTRGASAATTAGVANPVVSTAENGLSTGLAVLALAVPLAAAALFLLLAAWLVRKVFFRHKRTAVAAEAATPPRSD